MKSFLAAFLALLLAGSGILDEADRLRARGRWIDAYVAYRRAADAAPDAATRARAEAGIAEVHRAAAAARARRAPPAATPAPAPPPPTTPTRPATPASAPSPPRPRTALDEILEAVPPGRLAGVPIRAAAAPSAPRGGPSPTGAPTSAASGTGPAARAAALLREGKILPAYLHLSRTVEAARPSGGDARLEGLAAYASLRAGLHKEALAHAVAAEALSQGPRAVAHARLNHALILRRMSRPREAINLLAEIPPDVPGRDLLEANLMSDLGQYGAAEQILRRLAVEDPIASLNYAGILLEEGRAKEAVLHLERLYEAWPNDLVLLSRARARAATRDFTGAVRDYRLLAERGDEEMKRLALLSIARIEAEGNR